MTLGERIASLRKEKGLSQEALGELVGVTRQAVSKWEADKTLPDVNYCVALSRVFEVPLTRLLDLEDEQNDAPADELDERQLKLVEQMARQYAEAQRRIRRRYRWPLILLACALLVGAAWLWEWLDGMNRRVDYLSGEMAGMQGEIVSGVGDRVQESLREESSLITDYTIDVAKADILENTITYRITANLKEGNSGTIVSLMSRIGESVFEAETVQSSGLIYSGEITCPISDDTGVYLVVKQDEQSKSELLETLSLANDYNIHIEGWSRRASVEHGGLNKTPYEPVEVHISMYEAPGLPYPPKGTKTALGVFVNDRLVKEVPISLSNQKESYQEWRLTGEFDIPMQDVSTQTGDVVTFVALVADNYGRKASSVLSRYKILEGKELEYLAYDMLDLTGQTYGTEVWQ